MGAKPVSYEQAAVRLSNLSLSVEAALSVEAVRLALTVTEPPKGHEGTPGIWWDERGQEILGRIVKLVRGVRDG